jgi:hypothetical protein
LGAFCGEVRRVTQTGLGPARRASARSIPGGRSPRAKDARTCGEIDLLGAWLNACCRLIAFAPYRRFADRRNAQAHFRQREIIPGLNLLSERTYPPVAATV